MNKIANTQNDALWEGQEREFDTTRAPFGPLHFQKEKHA